MAKQLYEEQKEDECATAVFQRVKSWEQNKQVLVQLACRFAVGIPEVCNKKNQSIYDLQPNRPRVAYCGAHCLPVFPGALPYTCGSSLN